MAPSSTRPLKIVKRQQENQFFEEDLGGVPLRMMLIPGGSFLMGSPDGELERQEREGPQHEVTVPQFFLGKYPVTQAQWRAVAALEQVERELDADPSNFKGDDRPVEQVSWEDAQEFCARLSRETGKSYRLPSEAEWEYACRAGTTTPFHFGETITTDLANYCGQDREIERTTYPGSYGDGPLGEYREETTPVGLFEVANNFGLCDLHGNVREWCQDQYHDSYEGAPVDGSAWETGEAEVQLYMLRGGSWFFDPWICRSACRRCHSPSNRYDTVGFRVACVAPMAV